jgi:hypothetical protein
MCPVASPAGADREQRPLHRRGDSLTDRGGKSRAASSGLTTLSGDPVSTIALRPRSATEIIDASFQLLRQQYFQLVALAIVALLPYMLLQLLVSTTRSSAVAVAAVFVVQMLCTVAAEGTMIVAVSDGYVGGRVDVASALSRTLTRLLAILGAAIVRALMVAAAVIPVALVAAVVIPAVASASGGRAVAVIVGVAILVALFIPAIYIGLRTFATTAVLLLERTSVGGAIARAWHLADGEVGRIAFALFLAWLLYGVLFIVLTAIAGIIFGRNADLLAILTAVILAFAYPLVGVVTTLLYYDLRVRHEGFDLEVMARELEPHPTPLPKQ